MHFAIAEAFNASPYDVLNVWSDDMVRDALQILSARGRWRARHRPADGGG